MNKNAGDDYGRLLENFAKNQISSQSLQLFLPIFESQKKKGGFILLRISQPMYSVNKKRTKQNLLKDDESLANNTPHLQN